MAIQIRAMTAADVPLGMRLKTQATWNQVEADWRRFLTLAPDGCFVAELDGTPVGTATTCMFGEVAWIAAVLVDEAVRSRGVGRALMEHALALLDGHGIGTIRLDATPMGQPLYEKLGFRHEYELTRFDGVFPAGLPALAGVERGVAADWEAIYALDELVTGTDRRRLLRQLFTEEPDALRVVRRRGQIEGYLTSRPGANARFIGPGVGSMSAEPLLLADVARCFAGQRVFIDIPRSNRPAVQQAEELGLKGQRPLYRMCRGTMLAEKCMLLWASSGPEKG